MNEYSPFTDPTFDADRLEKNEIRVGKQIYARLPKMPGRVFTRDSVPEGVTLTQELSESDIAFLADRYTDEETGETHDEVVVIGQDISFALEGMMLVGRHYHAYFDTDGNLIADPLQKRREGKNVTGVPGTTVTRRLGEILRRKNWTRLGKKTVVRVPEIPGRIVKVRKEKDTVFIQLIYKTWKDPKTGQPRNRKTFIGKMVEYDVDAMYPNKQYETFFELETGELKHPFDDTPPEETDGNNQTDAETPEESLQTEDALMAEKAEKWDEEMPAIAGTDSREGENVTVVPGTTVTAREKSSEGAGKEKREDGISSEQIRKAVDKIIAEADEMRREEKRSKLQRAEEEERKKLRKEMQDEDDELMTEEDKEAVAFVTRLAEQIRREEEAKNGQAEEDGDEAEVGSDTLTDDSGTGYKCHIRPFFLWV